MVQQPCAILRTFQCGAQTNMSLKRVLYDGPHCPALHRPVAALGRSLAIVQPSAEIAHDHP